MILNILIKYNLLLNKYKKKKSMIEVKVKVEKEI